jgi:Transcription factor WhiB
MQYPDFFDKGPANCKVIPDPDIFFADPRAEGANETIDRAKSVCSGCPYIAECLDWALKNSEPGVWGGTSAAERRSMRRRATNTPRVYLPISPR